MRDRQPQIVITTDHPGSTCRIQITDNGVGMPETVQNSMFDPLFTKKEIGRDTGLNLAVSYQIVVEAHNSELYCESTPGEGTTGTITLPDEA